MASVKRWCDSKQSLRAESKKTKTKRIHAHDKTKAGLEATFAVNSTYEDVNAIQLRPLLFVVNRGEEDAA